MDESEVGNQLPVNITICGYEVAIGSLNDNKIVIAGQHGEGEIVVTKLFVVQLYRAVSRQQEKQMCL
jgi:hypothetical protein